MHPRSRAPNPGSTGRQGKGTEVVEAVAGAHLGDLGEPANDGGNSGGVEIR